MKFSRHSYYQVGAANGGTDAGTTEAGHQQGDSLIRGEGGVSESADEAMGQQPYRDDLDEERGALTGVDFEHGMFTINDLDDDIHDDGIHNGSQERNANTATTTTAASTMRPMEVTTQAKPSVMNRMSRMMPFSKSSHQSAQHEQLSNTSEIALPSHHRHSSRSTTNTIGNSTIDGSNDASPSSSQLPVSREQLTPPPSYVCPLTLQLYEEPVFDGCGHIFERTAILDWLEIHEMCPVSRKPCCMEDLQPATALRKRIEDWKRHPLQHHVEDQTTDLGKVIQYPDDEVDDAASPDCFRDDPEQQHCNINCTDTTCSESDETYSAVELMLLPQERKVLHVLRVLARDRQQRRTRRRYILLLAVLVVVAAAYAIRYIQQQQLEGGA